MAIRIIEATDAATVRRICMMIYGPAGQRKSTVASSAENPILLNFDEENAVFRVTNRKRVVQIDSWADAQTLPEKLLREHKTVIVDTVGRALDKCGLQIMRDDSKMSYMGALTQKGYGILKMRFTSWLQYLLSLDLDVILVAHMVEEKGKNDDVLERILAAGGSKNEIFIVADAIGRLVMDTGKLWLRFSPSDAAFGKNPAQLPPIEVPTAIDGNSTFLADIIGQTKAAMRRMSEEQQTVTLTLTEWAAQIAKADTPAALTKLIEIAGTLPANVQKAAKAALNSEAKARTWTYDATTKAFTAPAPKAAAGEQQEML